MNPHDLQMTISGMVDLLFGGLVEIGSRKVLPAC
jgi:hypothetical protein